MIRDSQGNLTLGLIAPIIPITLDAASLVAPELEDVGSANMNRDSGCVCSGAPCDRQGVNVQCDRIGWEYAFELAGVAKTHELVIRQEVSSAFEPAAVYALAEQPLTYAAERLVTSNSAQPIPWTGSRFSARFNDIERAIELSFDRIMHRDDNFQGKAIEWIYHVAHHYLTASRGDLEQFNFHRPDRYWNGHDGVTGGTFWVQWLRTKHRRYLDFAEANGRYRMDLATTNSIPDTLLMPYNRAPGTQNIYAILPWGRYNYGFAGHSNEVDYLIAYCYIAGYERACDAFDQRVELNLAYDHAADAPSANIREATSRLLELTILYREKDNSTILDLAELYLGRIELLQDDFGQMYDPDEPHSYLGSTLDSHFDVTSVPHAFKELVP